MNKLKQEQYNFTYDVHEERGVDTKYVVAFNSEEESGMLLRILTRREQRMYQKNMLFVDEKGLFYLKIISITTINQGLNMVENYLKEIRSIKQKIGGDSTFV